MFAEFAQIELQRPGNRRPLRRIRAFDLKMDCPWFEQATINCKTINDQVRGGEKRKKSRDEHTISK